LSLPSHPDCRATGAAVEYENGAYGVQYQLGDNPDKDRCSAPM
jgi:hypothetical protein